MTLDAIIIADSGSDSFSGTNPLKLNLEDRVADVQTVTNYVENSGHLKIPIAGEGLMNWASAPKLNGIYLISYLTHRGYKVAGIDSFYNQQADFRQLLEKNPRAIVISTTFITSKQTLTQMVAKIRLMLPDAKIIIGGPFVYLSYLISQRSQTPGYSPEEAKKEYLFLNNDDIPAADLYIINGQGEHILDTALKQLNATGSMGGLPNTATLENGTYNFFEQPTEFNPEAHTIDWESLPDSIFQSGVVPLQASSGCPHNCAFCNFVKDRHLASVKPLEELIAEMKQVRLRGARYVWFVDDNFRLGKNDLEAVCERFIQEDLGLRWMTFIRASTLDEVDAGLLRRAGCIEVQLGLESADHQVLENMNKRATPELYDRVLDKLLSNGINCSCYLIFGFPGETETSAQRTIDFMRRHESAEHEGSISWSIFPFLLAPLSPIYEMSAREKYELSGYLKNWRHATMDSEQAMHYVIKAFLEIEHSGPIYRSDNQDVLAQLNPSQRRRFQATRHALSKAAMQTSLSREDILSAFAAVL